MKALKSRTVWTFVFLFVLNGFEGVRDQVPPDLLPYINTLLTLGGIYFRVKPRQ